MKNKNNKKHFKHARQHGSVKSTTLSEAYLKTTLNHKFNPVCTMAKPGDASCTDLLTSLNDFFYPDSTGSQVDSFWIKNFKQLAQRSIGLLLKAGETVQSEIEN